MNKKYVSISEAAKLLNRTNNGARLLLSRVKAVPLEIKWGKRIVFRYRLSDVNKILRKGNLRPRRFCKSPSLAPVKDSSTGYMKIYNPRHSRAMSDGYVYEHWLVMEKIIGRSLHKKETVHHINRIRDDNRPENLMLFASRSEHMKLAHADENSRLLKNFMRDHDKRLSVYRNK